MGHRFIRPSLCAAVALGLSLGATARASVPLPRLQLTPLTLAAGGNGDNLDFNLLGESKPKEVTAAELALRSKAETRRTMLTLHQGVGLGTLALLAASTVVGQLNYMDRFAGGAANTAKWETPHTILVFATLAGFATTGMLGLLAPVPYDRPRSFDTTAFHKLCMAGATLGMAIELGLGLYTSSREGFSNQRTLGQVHQVIGYSTLGLMTMGASAFLF